MTSPSAAVAAPPRRRIAGLGVRLASGLVLLLLVTAAAAAGGSVFVALVAAAAALGAWEFAGLATRLEAAPPLWLLLPLSVWLAIRFDLPASLPALDLGLGCALVVGLLGTVVARLPWRGWMAALAGALLVGFPLGFFVAVLDWRPHDHRFGVAALAVPVLAVITCDTTAYLAGSVLGRHRFFPALSPKKSLEGAIAGLLGAVIAAALLGPLLLGLSPWMGALLGALVAVAAQAGDLAESALKRQSGVKDSSHLIPGHGGLLDRLDSLLLVAPVVYCLYRVIALG